ncbi:sacsin N-terminal ATP-binding-like domain-containing protein [Gordonia sp. NPDC003504]
MAEDRAAEADLATVGYRDRLFVELIANAADAAGAVGVGGVVGVWADDDGALHVANTGAPLTDSGVRSLLALRVSAKGDAHDPDVIGRFGVGFTATATVADRIEIRSRSGSVVFDRERAANAAAAAGIETAAVPVLRLAWPTDVAPAQPFDTEVVLHLRPDVDVGKLLESAADQAPGLLLALAGVDRITVADNDVEIERTAVPETDPAIGSTMRRLVITRTAGPETRTPQVWTEVARPPSRWLISRRADGESVEPIARDVLWAPTPTEIELSLPCRLIADLPLTPDRRHLHPDADISSAAVGYTDVMRCIAGSERLSLVPSAHRARGRVDAQLIEAVLDELRVTSWLPGIDESSLVPARAVVLIGLTDALAELLGDAFADLVSPELSLAQHLALLESLGVERLGLAGLAERLAGLEREPRWWGRLYEALAPLVATPLDVEELAALPVPRADGRTNFGVRGLFSAGAVSIPLRWIHTIAPDADHPLLLRVGAQPLSIPEALADPALRALVEAAVDLADSGEDDDEVTGLAEEVLALLAADPDVPTPEWLSRIPLRDSEGEFRSADEMVLADSPLLAVLVEDHPFSLVADEMVGRFGVGTLRRLGVGWGFAVVRDDLPTGPDHELPDEEQWWDTLSAAPESICAVRDLDLVDPDKWPAALTLLATDPDIAATLDDRAGYTAWWLRNFAEIDGLLLGEYRAASDTSLDGVLDQLDHPHADAFAAAVASLPPASSDEASLLITRVGDPRRQVSPGVARGVYAAVVDACRAGAVDWRDVAEPEGVRAASGAATGSAILDAPWWAQAIDPDDLVVGPADADGASLLADILDLPTVGEAFSARVDDEGRPATGSSTAAVLFTAETGRALLGQVRVHDELWITLSRNGTDHKITVRVRWWVDYRGITHLGVGR